MIGLSRRGLLAVAFAALAAACAPETPAVDPTLRDVLAPTGRLRVGLYPGTPTSILPATGTDAARGVGYEMGREFAKFLGLPYEPVVFAKNDEVLAAVKAGRVDVAFTNASAERAREMDFTQAYLDIELGYLVRPASPIGTLSDVDRAGMRVGVTEKSSSDARLTREFTQAQIVRAATLKDGIALLGESKIDAYATNKASLFEMSDQLPGSRVLDGRWGVERHALALPKGRDAGLSVARRFVETAIGNGTVQAAIDRAGLRGAVVAK